MRTCFPAHPARLLLVIIAALLLMAATAFADPITARVVSVHDGDTITVLTMEKRQIKIRFAEIDAPELAQPYGKKSKQLLSRMVFGKDVSIMSVTTDKYRRTVASRANSSASATGASTRTCTASSSTPSRTARTPASKPTSTWVTSSASSML